MFPDGCRNLQPHLWRIIALFCLDIHINGLCHVQDDVVIVRIAVVPVQEPVGRTVVYLYIAHPQRSADLHFRIEEIGTCIAVMQSGINDFHLLSVSGLEPRQRKHFVFPYVVEELFHNRDSWFYRTQIYEKNGTIDPPVSVF